MKFAVTLMLLSCALISQRGFCADWVRVPAAGADEHYYDRSKIVIQGDEITYWRKVVFANSVRVANGVARQAIYQERIDCHDHTLQSLAWQLYAASGVLLESSTTPDADAKAIVPETIGDRFQTAMCKQVEDRQRRIEELRQDEALVKAKRKELETLKAEIERLESTVRRIRALDPALAEPPAKTDEQGGSPP
ncbi:MAG: hypothetical protein GC151_06750 [Betaproteobacteria bacterium]|nr:hypothetical protein [Betaproteobacteria bacterium]